MKANIERCCTDVRIPIRRKAVMFCFHAKSLTILTKSMMLTWNNPFSFSNCWKRLFSATMMMQARTDFGTGSNRGASHSSTMNISTDDNTLTSCVFPPATNMFDWARCGLKTHGRYLQRDADASFRQQVTSKHWLSFIGKLYRAL